MNQIDKCYYKLSAYREGHDYETGLYTIDICGELLFMAKRILLKERQELGDKIIKQIGELFMIDKLLNKIMKLVGK